VEISYYLSQAGKYCLSFEKICPSPLKKVISVDTQASREYIDIAFFSSTTAQITIPRKSPEARGFPLEAPFTAYSWLTDQWIERQKDKTYG
jgi:hypothetical protein